MDAKWVYNVGYMKRIVPLLLVACFFFAVRPAARAATPSSCDELRVVSGNNKFVPSAVAFHARATDPSGTIQSYRWFFGDGSQEDSAAPDITHNFTVSGSFTAKLFIKDAAGVWKSSSSCQTIFSLLNNPLESHKSGCSNVFVLGDNTVPAGTTVNFLVTGYENKSGIKEYSLDLGSGQVLKNSAGTFSQKFDAPGTYTARGSVRDSKNNWVSSDSCWTSLYVTGSPIIVQPATGTPTWITVTGILSGIAVFYLLIRKSCQNA